MKWVRERYGKYRWEFAKDGKFWSHGYYKSEQECYDACVRYQMQLEQMKTSGLVFPWSHEMGLSILNEKKD